MQNNCEYLIGTNLYGGRQSSYKCATKEEYLAYEDAKKFTPEEMKITMFIVFGVFLCVLFLSFFMKDSTK